MATEEQIKEEHSKGATCRALGGDEFSNPWLKAENMPAQTGMQQEEYRVLVEAWTIGWKAEDLIRSVDQE